MDKEKKEIIKRRKSKLSSNISRVSQRAQHWHNCPSENTMLSHLAKSRLPTVRSYYGESWTHYVIPSATKFKMFLPNPGRYNVRVPWSLRNSHRIRRGWWRHSFQLRFLHQKHFQNINTVWSKENEATHLAHLEIYTPMELLSFDLLHVSGVMEF